VGANAAVTEPVALDLTVARARGGDSGAFEELYRQHAGRIYALCLRLSADPARAEDHTQDTFVAAWRKLGSFRGESAFGTWLTSVALNIVRGEGRVRARDAVHLEANAASLPLAAAPGPGVRSVDLERAIGALPPAARHVFVLHDVEGFKHEEIARLLGVTPGTSKSQLHRARGLLREALCP